MEWNNYSCNNGVVGIQIIKRKTSKNIDGLPIAIADKEGNADI
jgi:hypothetical protein